jgi:hypothetical protein
MAVSLRSTDSTAAVIPNVELDRDARFLEPELILPQLLHLARRRSHSS